VVILYYYFIIHEAESTLEGETGFPLPTLASAAHIIRSLGYKATVSIPSGAHGGGREGLGEDGTETALYHIPKEMQLTWRGKLASPFQRSLPLAASPSRAGHEPTPCDQGIVPLGSRDDRFPAAGRRAIIRSSKPDPFKKMDLKRSAICSSHLENPGCNQKLGLES